MKITHFLPLAAFCLATSCAQKEADSGFMNPDADPGTDFFEYANGGWNAAHPLTAEYSRYGVMDDIAENNRKQLRDLIEGLAAEPHEAGSLEQKIGDLYKLAMDSTRRNAEGWTPIRSDLNAVQGARDKAGLLRVIAHIAHADEGDAAAGKLLHVHVIDMDIEEDVAVDEAAAQLLEVAYRLLRVMVLLGNQQR